MGEKTEMHTGFPWGNLRERDYFTSSKRPGTPFVGGGWVPGPVWTGVENLAPTGI
jgi:hypothetical protein